MIASERKKTHETFASSARAVGYRLSQMSRLLTPKRVFSIVGSLSMVGADFRANCVGWVAFLESWVSNLHVSAALTNFLVRIGLEPLELRNDYGHLPVESSCLHYTPAVSTVRTQTTRNYSYFPLIHIT